MTSSTNPTTDAIAEINFWTDSLSVVRPDPRVREIHAKSCDAIGEAISRAIRNFSQTKRKNVIAAFERYSSAGVPQRQYVRKSDVRLGDASESCVEDVLVEKLDAIENAISSAE